MHEIFPFLSAADGPAASFSHLLGVLVAAILLTKLLGEVAQRFGQPSVLGELLAGVVLGGSLLGILEPGDPVIHALAELGVLILLFQIGLHTELRALLAVGPAAGAVGVTGVVLPFALGYWVSNLMGLGTLQALVCSAALTATSIGISARVLADLEQLNTPEGRVVIGAAVFDDVVGLIVLAVVTGLAAGADVNGLSIARTSAVAVGFVVVSITAGSFLLPPIFRRIARFRVSGALGVMALALALAMAWLADVAGSAPIIGAFAAGLILHGTPQAAAIEESAKGLGYFFVPIFFAAVGASVDVASFADSHVLVLGGALIAVGIVGKFVAGYTPWWFKGNKALIGVAMIPRGEVGLIFAQMGLARRVLDEALFSALALMVMVTTLITPPLLGLLTRRSRVRHDTAADRGVEALVAGTELEDLAEPEAPGRPADS